MAADLNSDYLYIVTNCTVSQVILPGGFVSDFNCIMCCFFPRVNLSRMRIAGAVWDPPLWL